MISAGRYGYHLDDIAEIEAMKGSVPAFHFSLLVNMRREAREFEDALRQGGGKPLSTRPGRAEGSP